MVAAPTLDEIVTIFSRRVCQEIIDSKHADLTTIKELNLGYQHKRNGTGSQGFYKLKESEILAILASLVSRDF